MTVVATADPGTPLHSVPVPPVRDLAWSRDGSRIWLATDSGLYAVYLPTNTLTQIDGTDAVNIHVLPGDRAIAVGSGGPTGYDPFLDVATATGATTYSHLTTPIGNGGSGPAGPFTTNPAGTEVWLSPQNTYSLLDVNIASGAILTSLPGVSTTTTNVDGVSSDPTANRLIVTRHSNSGTATQIAIFDAPSLGPFEFLSVPADSGVSLDKLGRPIVSIPPPPTATFGASSGLGGSPMSFFASASSTKGTTVASYHWHWGDGSPDTDSTTATTEHTFPVAAPTTYHVTLTAIDSVGAGGAGSGYWDGQHWFSHGGPSASFSQDVAVGSGSATELRINGSNVSGQHVPYDAASVSLQAFVTPAGAGFNEAQDKIHYYVDSIDKGPMSSYIQGDGAFTTLPVTASFLDAGVHTLAAAYVPNGASSVQPSQSTELEVIVDHVASDVAAAAQAAEVATGASVAVDASVKNSCGGGIYATIVDGANGPTANPAPIEHGTTIAIPGLADGPHTMRVTWTPDGPDTRCSPSIGAPFAVSVGTSPTTTTLSAPATSPPGAVKVTATVIAKSGDTTEVPSSGTVTIKDGATTLGAGPIDASGNATVSVTLSTLGTHALTASFAHTGVAYGPSTSAPANVLIGTPPGAPSLTSLTSGSGSLTVACKAPTTDGSAPITGYAATATPLDAPNGAPVVVKAAACPITVGGLVNGEAYRVTVAATNLFGTGAPSTAKVGVAGVTKGVSLLLSKNPVPLGQTLRFYGYAVNHGAPLAHHAVKLSQRLSTTITLKTVTTDKNGRFTYSLKLSHTGAVRASTSIDGHTVFSKELLAKVAFVIRGLKAKVIGGRVIVTGAIAPGSPAQHERKTRVAVYRSDAAGTKGAYIGDAKLAASKRGASSTSFTYNHPAALLAGATYVYVNPLGTTVNASTHTVIRVVNAIAAAKAIARRAV